jgi:hypothetical protein
MSIVWIDDVTPLSAANMNQLEQMTRKGVPNGYASLGADGLVVPAQLPPAPDLAAYQAKAEKGQPDGYLGLDANTDLSLTPIQELVWPLGRLGQGAGGLAVTGALSATDTITTDGTLVARTAIDLWKVGDASPLIEQVQGVVVAGTPGLRFGSGAAAADAVLYRAGAGVLKVAGSDGASPAVLRAAGSLMSEDRITAEVGEATEVKIGRDPAGTKAAVAWGGDTMLYRNGAGLLRTDGTIDANGLSINGVPVGTGGADATKVDKDSVVVAATRIVANKLLAGDAQPAFRILGSGRQEWGAGGAAAADAVLYRELAGRLRTDTFFRAQDTTIGGIGPSGVTGIRFLDTDLYRSGANLLKTDGALTLGMDLTVANGGSGSIYFGSALDTNLYRAAAAQLRTDGDLLIGQSAVVAYGNPAGKLYFGSAVDTSLYRAASGVVKTDGYFYAGQAIYANQGAATQVGLVAVGGSQAGLSFGSAGDANLYRAAAGTLKTDGVLSVGSHVQTLGHLMCVSDTGKLFFGTAADTNLYRSAATALRTDGTLQSGSIMQAAFGTANEVGIGWGGLPGAGLYFGNAADTNLYRLSSGALKTDGSLQAVGLTSTGSVTATDHLVANKHCLVDNTDVGARLYFGSALDASLYRSAASRLKTDGALDIGNDIVLATVGNAVGSGTALVMQTTAGVRRVEIGAVDSAGAGFRSLRVSN